LKWAIAHVFSPVQRNIYRFIMGYSIDPGKIFTTLTTPLVIIIAITVNLPLGTLIVLAEPVNSEPNPLETTTPDSLTPSLRRNLTPLQRRRLRENLDELNEEAKAELEAGNDDQAFKIWYRELRLRRFLGQLEEIEALGRVGASAWDKSRNEDVKIITKRLQNVQKEAEAETSLTPELLTAFAEAYQQVHSLDDLINIQQKILANTRQEKDVKAEEETLNILGKLYLSKFAYPQAAEVYHQLLNLAQAQSNTYTEGIYLQQLAEIYTQALQPENAVKIKEDLVKSYLTNKKITAIPPLKIAIGSDYEALSQPEKASQNYQEAFSLAWTLQQFSHAEEALTKLGNLYHNYEEDNYALQIYQKLIQVQQQSYNYYGLMNTYDRIGKIYLSQKNYPQALISFRQGLEVARSLSYQVDYFLSQIEQVKKEEKESKETPQDDKLN
jgi:tetratricopeptide (TPR) repeat protein